MKIYRIVISLVIVAFLVTACKSTGSKSDAVQETTPLDDFQAKASEVMPQATNPTDLSTLLQLTAATYMPKLVSDPLSVGKYKDKPLFAAGNFGIYCADAIYQFSFDSINAALASWDAAKVLSTELGFSQIFDSILIVRVEEGLTPKDSIFVQIGKAFNKLGETYTEAEKHRIYTAILAGNYIEKVHLVMGNIFEANTDLPSETRFLLNRELFMILIGQLKSLDGLIALVEKNETISDPGFISLELKEMRNIYNSFDLSSENLAQIDPDKVFNNPKVNELRKHIESIRTYIISGVAK